MNTAAADLAPGAMSLPRAYLLTHNKRLARAVTRTLVPRKIEVHVISSHERAPRSPHNRDLLLIDYDSPRRFELGALDELAQRHRLIVFSQRSDKERLAELLGTSKLTNIIANNRGPREEELLTTVHKLLTGHVFGIEQYLARATAPVQVEIKTPQARRAALESMERFLTSSMVNKRYIELARTSADELLANALFRSNPNAQATERSKPVALRYGCDGRYVALAVEDRYGSLTEQQLLRVLRRCVNMTDYQIPTFTAGAGLGLFMVLRSSDQLVINIEPGARTEVICLIDIRGSIRDFEERSKSLHMFIKGE